MTQNVQINFVLNLNQDFIFNSIKVNQVEETLVQMPLSLKVFGVL